MPNNLILLFSRNNIFSIKKFFEIHKPLPDFIDSQGNTLLHLAVLHSNNVSIIQFVYEYNKENINIENNDGDTPLMLAAKAFKTEIANFLILKDANIENHQSELFINFFAKTGQTKLLGELIDAGVDIESVDKDLRTCLHLACFHNQIDTVKLLISAGANLNAYDKDNKTPLQLAGSKGYFNIVSIFNEENQSFVKDIVKRNLGERNWQNKLILEQNAKKQKL
ncbi:MAG: ankyrin repeat domain-containing protein [Alphaproteobacteria bacterium]